MEVELRRETPTDYRTVEELIREAFWNHYVPGCCEHYLAHILRNSAAFVPELDFVAQMDGRVVGNIMYTKAKIMGDDGVEYPVLCFGPLAVLSEHQGKGIGMKLIERTQQEARELGYSAILIMGDPEFYKRAGFRPAQEFGIGTAWDTYSPALLAYELTPGVLANCRGKFQEDPAFDVKQEDVAEFDKTFPPKQKKEGLPSQQRFMELCSVNEPRT